jgi:hypothetical protein
VDPVKIEEPAYQQLKTRFLEKLPGFVSFKASKEYIERERRYKDDLCRIFDSTIRPQLAAATAVELQALGKSLLDMMTKPLPSDGKPQNIVDWRTHSVLIAAGRTANGEADFAREVQALLTSRENLKDRLKRFTSYVRQLPTSNNRGLSAAATRRLGSFLLTLFDRRACVFIKTKEFKRLFDLLGLSYKLDDGGLSDRDVTICRDIAAAIFERLKEEGWQPADLIDAQGFIWTALNEHERGVEWESVISEEAIRNGYLLISGAPVGFFPEESFGGNNDDDLGEQFRLVLPDGREIQTDIRGNRATRSGRIRHRFSSVFRQAGVEPGDIARFLRSDEGLYELSITHQASGKRNEMNPATPIANAQSVSLNRILYGPPGTGKTYHAITEALAILDPQYLAENRANRSLLKARFDMFVRDNRVRVVTFHQSFSYEDFVEGIRVATDSEDASVVTYP